MIPFQHGVFATAAGAASGFEAIATVTASGGETSLTFSSIPQTYTSLQIRGIGFTSGGSTVLMRINSDSGANYALHELFGNGTAAYAVGSTGEYSMQAAASIAPTTTYPSAMVIDLHDYASTTRNKTMRSFAGTDKNGSGYVQLNSGLWLSTNAVSTVSLLMGSGFTAGSTFALYGIKAAA